MKHQLIMSGAYDNFLELKKMLWLNHMDYNNKSLYSNLMEQEEIDECFRIYNATRQRKKNNWNELCKWSFAITYLPKYKDYKLLFGTLTFTDKVLNDTSKKTRQVYITRFLKDNTIHYMANIDFGSKNNREHYHFIAMVKDKLNCNLWKYGASKFQFIPLESKDLRKTKNYLLKLNNHSYKSSTKENRIIRDRNIDFLEKYINLFGDELFRRYKMSLNVQRL